MVSGKQSGGTQASCAEPDKRRLPLVLVAALAFALTLFGGDGEPKKAEAQTVLTCTIDDADLVYIAVSADGSACSHGGEIVVGDFYVLVNFQETQAGTFRAGNTIAHNGCTTSLGNAVAGASCLFRAGMGIQFITANFISTLGEQITVSATGTATGVGLTSFSVTVGAVDAVGAVGGDETATSSADAVASQAAAVNQATMGEVVRTTNGLINDAALAAFDPAGDVKFGSGSLIATFNTRRRAADFDNAGAAAGDVPLGERWGAWGKFAYTHVNSGIAGFGIRADTYVGLVGVDYKPTEDFVIGTALGYEVVRAAVDSVNGDQDSDGLIISPYAAWNIMPGLVWQGNVGFVQITNNLDQSDGAVSGEFDSHRFFLSSSLRGSTDLGPTRLVMDGGVWYAREMQRAYSTDQNVEINNQSFEAGRLSFAVEWGYPLIVGDGSALEPYAMVAGEYDFAQTKTQLVGGQSFAGDRFGGRAGLGLRMDIAGAGTGEIAGSYDSIGRSDLDVFSIKGDFRIPF